MLKKLYDKSKIWFAVVWIIAYCLLMSVGDTLSGKVGIEKSATLPIGILLSVIVLIFLQKHGLLKDYGLCRSKASARELLYYIPLLVLLTANLWWGVAFRYGVTETVLYILAMFCVGFLEEIIFRGFLFHAMAKDNRLAAVVVSSITFGIGHIINLVNGSGAQLIPNLLQVVYATAAGFMFVMLYCKAESLWGCIFVHGLFNALSVFSVDPPSMGMQVLTCLLITAISGGYGLYLLQNSKGK